MRCRFLSFRIGSRNPRGTTKDGNSQCSAELENIGGKLKALRKEKDESLEEVANSIGSSKSLLSKYERDLSEPGLRVLKKLADHFNVSLDYLFGFYK